MEVERARVSFARLLRKRAKEAAKKLAVETVKALPYFAAGVTVGSICLAIPHMRGVRVSIERDYSLWGIRLLAVYILVQLFIVLVYRFRAAQGYLCQSVSSPGNWNFHVLLVSVVMALSSAVLGFKGISGVSISLLHQLDLYIIALSGAFASLALVRLSGRIWGTLKRHKKVETLKLAFLIAVVSFWLIVSERGLEFLSYFSLKATLVAVVLGLSVGAVLLIPAELVRGGRKSLSYGKVAPVVIYLGYALIALLDISALL